MPRSCIRATRAWISTKLARLSEPSVSCRRTEGLVCSPNVRPRHVLSPFAARIFSTFHTMLQYARFVLGVPFEHDHRAIMRLRRKKGLFMDLTVVRDKEYGKGHDEVGASRLDEAVRWRDTTRTRRVAAGMSSLRPKNQ